ncbi:MAG: hypothetical protein WBC70_08630 [Candidatus Aminicenantales bacterium]
MMFCLFLAGLAGLGLSAWPVSAHEEESLPAASFRGKEPEGCTVIGVGRLATADGSVITSRTDCCSECRVHVVPAQTYPKGTMGDFAVILRKCS